MTFFSIISCILILYKRTKRKMFKRTYKPKCSTFLRCFQYSLIHTELMSKTIKQGWQSESAIWRLESAGYFIIYQKSKSTILGRIFIRIRTYARYFLIFYYIILIQIILTQFKCFNFFYCFRNAAFKNYFRLLVNITNHKDS